VDSGVLAAPVSAVEWAPVWAEESAGPAWAEESAAPAWAEVSAAPVWAEAEESAAALQSKREHTERQCQRYDCNVLSNRLRYQRRQASECCSQG